MTIPQADQMGCWKRRPTANKAGEHTGDGLRDHRSAIIVPERMALILRKGTASLSRNGNHFIVSRLG
jgi:hypothetical protein